MKYNSSVDPEFKASDISFHALPLSLLLALNLYMVREAEPPYKEARPFLLSKHDRPNWKNVGIYIYDMMYIYELI